MGAAFDLRCENDNMQSTLNKKNRQLREQKKLLIELAEGILNSEVLLSNDLYNTELCKKAKNILNKLNKKK